MLTPAETRYSATKREALAAKESLVRFQPFIEGESILLVMDHSALTWAKTYENANRRLAAWGLVFAAFPEMVIIHRPGRTHSNVNPLSHLPRIPTFVSPARDDLPEQSLSTDHEELQRAWNEFIRNRELVSEGKLVILQRNKKGKERDLPQSPSALVSEALTAETKSIAKPRTETHLHVFAKEDMIKRFIKGYTADKDFSKLVLRTHAEEFNERKYHAYRVAENGLLYFKDADSHLRLCVPNAERYAIIQAVHDEAHEGAPPPPPNQGTLLLAKDE